MGDLALQTSVEPAGEGRYRAMVHQDWEIWGPCGGYVAAIALRAAGAESPFARPASFFCHYLSVAAFAPVDLVVTPLRSGRTVLAQRVEMTQDGRAVLDAMVWSVGQVEGLEHVDVGPPAVSDPADTPAWTRPPARRERGREQGRRPAALCVLGQLRTATHRLDGDVAAARTAAAHLAHLGPLQARRPSKRGRLGSMPPACSSCSTSGAGRRARGRTPMPTRPSSPPASTSTPPSRIRRANPSGS